MFIRRTGTVQPPHLDLLDKLTMQALAGATPLGTGAATVSGYAFTPFADLTQDDVLNWIWLTLPSGHGKEYYEQKVSGELVYKMNYQTEEPALPWNPPVPPPSGSL